MIDDFTDFLVLHHLLNDDERSFDRFIDSQLATA